MAMLNIYMALHSFCVSV